MKPNPAKAADGKRLPKLDLDPEAAPVVKRIFAEFTVGHGFYAIAVGLTRDDIPSPSAHDPERNKHRSGVAWNKFAVRAILENPRYTGHQVCKVQYRAALDAGASPVTVAGWIAETEAEKARYEAGLRQVAKGSERMTEQEIRSIVDKLADIARVLSRANADDKSQIFRQL